MINYIMLTWNRKAFLEVLFEKFYKNNSIADFNFFVTDNGSTDGTTEFLRALSENDPRVKVKYNDKNLGLQEYKNLFKSASAAAGEYIIVLDDDVLDFPENFDQKLISALSAFPDVGFIALDVVQNEYTNGAKPNATYYKDYSKNGVDLQLGPVGGWCSIITVKDYKKIKFFVNLRRLSMAKGEDATIVGFLRLLLNKKSAILKNEKCLHAAGPYYSKKYGFLERDIKKYHDAGLQELEKLYASYRMKEI